MNRDVALAALLGLLALPLLLLPFLPSEDMGGPSVHTLSRSSFPYETYTVRAGDSFSSIASRQGIPLEYLVASNPHQNPDNPEPGRVLLLPQGGVIHTLRSGQTLEDVAVTYDVDAASLKWDERTANPKPGAQVYVPNPGTVPQSDALKLGASEANRFIWPLRGRMSSPFGWRTHPIRGGRHFHSGLDVAVPEGTPVRASAAGEVTDAGWVGDYGILVIIDHGGGFSTYYAHLSQAVARPGQYVEQGQVIGLSGNTGLSTGPHLHFEIRRQGVPVNPEHYLP